MFAKRLLLGSAALIALGTSASLTACSDDGADAGQRYVVTVDLDTASAPFVLHNVGAEKEHRYGHARLTGPSEFAGEPIDVELLCNVNYTNGNGPFEGFWTFTAANGDELAFTYEGKAEQRGDVGYINGKVKVLGGTGRFVNVVGSGTVTAKRDGSVGSGSAIPYTIDLRLDGLA